MKLNPGDLVLIMHEERPAERAQRAGGKPGRLDGRKRRVAFFDEVESVALSKAVLKHDKSIDIGEDGKETSASENRRRTEKGEKKVQTFVVDKSQLALNPAFVLAPGTRIDLDDEFVENVLERDPRNK